MEGDSPVVCGILQDINAGSIRAGEPICICIPMNDARRDQWTKLLLRSFRSKDAEGRGVTVRASEALEGYLAGGRGGEGEEGTVEYTIVSFIVPRLTEVLINLALTFWFRFDGFSSALLARRTIRDYLVDNKGNGLAANAFLTKALVKSNARNTQVFQVLTFRGNVFGIRGLSFIVGCVNLISAIGWALLIAMEDRADTSPPLSMPIVLIIIGTIGMFLGMDVASVNVALVILSPVPLLILLPFLPLLWLFKVYPPTEFQYISLILFLTTLGLEIVYIVSGSAVVGILGIKGFGRWIYDSHAMLMCPCSEVPGKNIVYLQASIHSFYLEELLQYFSEPNVSSCYQRPRFEHNMSRMQPAGVKFDGPFTSDSWPLGYCPVPSAIGI